MAVSAVDLLCVFGRSLVMFDQVTPSSSSVFGFTVFSILSVVLRRGLQQCYNNISVFIHV